MSNIRQRTYWKMFVLSAHSDSDLLDKVWNGPQLFHSMPHWSYFPPILWSAQAMLLGTK